MSRMSSALGRGLRAESLGPENRRGRLLYFRGEDSLKTVSPVEKGRGEGQVERWEGILSKFYYYRRIC
jgi:hypothetical protein